MQDAHGRHFGRAGQHIIGERRGERLPVASIGHLLVERGADALRRAAVNLAVDDHRVDERAAVLDDHIVESSTCPNSVSTATSDGVAGIAERAGIALAAYSRDHFEPARIDVGRQEVRLRDTRYAQFRPASALPSRCDPLRRPSANLRDGTSKKMRCDFFTRVAELLACACDRAARHHHAARAPRARRIRRDAGIAMHDANSLADRCRGSRVATCASVVSRLWPCECAPMRSSSTPSGVRRAQALLVPRHHRNAPAVIDRRAVRRLLAINRDADADTAAVRFTLLSGARAISRTSMRRDRAPHGFADSRRESKCFFVMLS